MRPAPLLLAASALSMAGCAAVAPAAKPALSAAEVPPQWQAPLPHGGTLATLQDWWTGFDDPLLAELVQAAQAASPNVATAGARIREARRDRVAAGAALLPAADAVATAVRGPLAPSAPVAQQAQAGLQFSWELDLFGRNRAGADAAGARLDGATSRWHEARVATAAETASTYVELRACEARTQQIETDAGSRDASAGLTQRMVEAGMQAPAQAALARASTAQGQAALLQQAAACDTLVKSLVALTAIDEPALRRRLQPAQARLPQPRALAVDTVPAQALAQRPDLRAAAQDLLAASADVRQADADRWPRISIGGFLGHMRVGDGPGRDQGSVWQLGPLTVSLPVFDAGLRSANADAARARHDAAESVYRGALRQAVREVESALVELQSAAGREPALQRAAADYRVSFVSVEQRQRGGLATVFELEDARRSDVGAQLALTDVRRERVLAWIALYRALGGGWNGAQAAPLALAAR